MPQLSIETFVTQYFWLIVFLFGFYLIAVTAIIPSIASAFKLRKKLTAVEEGEGSADIAKEETTSWNQLIHVSHEVWSPADLKSYYFNNNDWIKSKS
jgi:hypothetical protein